MADEIDIAQDREQLDRDLAVQSVARRAQQFEVGASGECDICGRYFKRVVQRTLKREDVMACGGCRDEMGLG